MRKTPFYDVGLQYGADMQDLFGYALPWEYSAGHVQEHLGTRERVSLCDLDYMAEFWVVGPDARAFVQEVCTNDYSKVKPGQMRYTAFCKADGNMIDDGTVWCFEDSRFLIMTGDESDYEWFSGVVNDSPGKFQVDLENVTSEWTTLALQGPRARDTLGKLFSLKLLDEIRYYHFTESVMGSVECIVNRMGYTGEFGYELHFHPRDGARMWEAIMESGREYDIVPCGQAALESLRQEAGYLLVGNDHDKNTNPLEAGIGFAVKFGKGDFIGRQALAEIRTRGISRRLVWFKLRGEGVATKGDKITSAGADVGEVTSGSYSPTQRRGVAMGYVRPEVAIAGLDYAITINGEEHAASLSMMPLYDPGDTLTKK
jgi:aminomethyltransferase